MGNENLQMSRSGRTDEFYTRLEDVIKEIRHYKAYFRGKKVLCNCDDPYVSNFFFYFVRHFAEFGLRSLICISYCSQVGPDGQYTQSEALIKKVGPCAQKFVLPHPPDPPAELVGDRSLFLSYLFNFRGNTITPLEGDGDFRSEECLAILNEADIVVTNPPFSLMKTYLPLLIERGKSFIILGNVNHITLGEIKPYLLAGRFWLGYEAGHFWFRVPSYYEEKGTDYKQDETGQKWRRMGNSCWFTNIDIPKRHVPLELTETFSADAYPHYDDVDAVECSATRLLPADHFGTIGVPVSYLPYHCPEQFEILDIVTPKLNGKTKYKRLLIRRIDQNDPEVSHG